MKFYNIGDQVDDIFTKALIRDQFEENRLKLGLIKMNWVPYVDFITLYIGYDYEASI